MAENSTLTPFDRRDVVVALEDMPGIPKGSRGRVVTRVGLTWDRYFVHFDNGVDRGSIGRDALALASETDLADPALGGDAPPATTPPIAWIAVVLSVLVAPAGAILGHMALGRIEAGGGRLSGRTVAIAAIIIGWTLTAALFFGAVYAISI